MSSIRSKLVIASVKMGGLLHDKIDETNLAEKRQRFTKLEKFFPVSKSVKITEARDKDFKGEWLDAPSVRADKVMLYLHGGGFVFNSTKLHRDTISRIAKAAQIRAFSLDYSLAPEHPYPTALNEAVASYKWLLAKGFKAKNIVVAGDSAGGALALSLLHRVRKDKLPFPACAVVLSPATDASLTNSTIEVNRSKDFYINPDSLKFFIRAYFQQTPTTDPVASPLFGSLRGFPPLLIHVDKDEIMNSDSVRLARKARHEDVHVILYQSEGLFHVWHVFARYMPEAKKSIKDIGEFIKLYLDAK